MIKTIEYDQKRYDRLRATCFIAVVGSETEITDCRDSVNNLRLRYGDSQPAFFRGTKGYESRQAAIEKFLATNHGCILLLDQDETFPPDTLEQLRSHGLPFVSGLYMRRQFKPIAPVWAEPNEENIFPMKPWLQNPEPGKLYELGASGWGCVLIHREVFDAVKPLLKGEPYVIEDDMDVYPYDLDRVMAAINTLDKESNKNVPDMVKVFTASQILKDEIKPLRGVKDVVGSDIRFPYFARLAGYPLYGDPSVRCGHMINYPLTPDDYAELHKYQPEVVRELNERVAKMHEEDRARRKQLEEINLEAVR